MPFGPVTTIRVSLLRGGPGVNFDLLTFSFQVPGKVFHASLWYVYLSQVTVAMSSNFGKFVRVSDVVRTMFMSLLIYVRRIRSSTEQAAAETSAGASRVNRRDEGEKSANAAGGPVCTE
jgi:hypothetical protein